MTALRLGVMLGCATPPPHLSRLLDVLAQGRPLELSLLVLAPTRGAGLGDSLARLILGTERGILNAIGRLSPAIARRAGGQDAGSTGLRSRFAQVLDGETAGKSRNLPALDLLLVFGCDTWKAGDLPVCAGEIIQVRLGSGMPASLHQAGFAEAFAGADETPLALHLLREGGDSQRLIGGGNRTRQLFLLNQSALWDRAASLLLSRLLDAGQTKITAVAPGVRDDAVLADHHQRGRSLPVGSARQIARLLAYPLRLCGRFTYLALRQLSGKRQWTTAIHRRGSEYAAGEKLPMDAAPAGTYWADPFLYRCPNSGTSVCFVEEYDKAAGRGHIAVLEQEPSGWRYRGAILKAPHHLSFPFVFDYEGSLYMCPEGGASGTITLYRCIDFPAQWAPCATLMSGVSAADTMLFPRNGRWWMLTNIDRAQQPDHQSELHLFHAPSPLSEAWTAVPGNPVKLTCRGARNGGLLVDGERVFRFGQVQGFHAYGQGLNLYEITGLDESGYREVFVKQVLPPAGSGSVGIHTWSGVHDLVAVDLLGAASPAPAAA